MSKDQSFKPLASEVRLHDAQKYDPEDVRVRAYCYTFRSLYSLQIFDYLTLGSHLKSAKQFAVCTARLSPTQVIKLRDMLNDIIEADELEDFDEES